MRLEEQKDEKQNFLKYKKLDFAKQDYYQIASFAKKDNNDRASSQNKNNTNFDELFLECYNYYQIQIDTKSQNELLEKIYECSDRIIANNFPNQTTNNNTNTNLQNDILVGNNSNLNAKIYELGLSKDINMVYNQLVDPILKQNINNLHILFDNKYIDKFSIDHDKFIITSLKIINNFENYSEAVVEIGVSLVRIAILNFESRQVFIENNGIEKLLYILFYNNKDKDEEKDKDKYRRDYKDTYKKRKNSNYDKIQIVSFRTKTTIISSILILLGYNEGVSRFCGENWDANLSEKNYQNMPVKKETCVENESGNEGCKSGHHKDKTIKDKTRRSRSKSRSRTASQHNTRDKKDKGSRSRSRDARNSSRSLSYDNRKKDKKSKSKKEKKYKKKDKKHKRKDSKDDKKSKKKDKKKKESDSQKRKKSVDNERDRISDYNKDKRISSCNRDIRSSTNPKNNRSKNSSPKFQLITKNQAIKNGLEFILILINNESDFRQLPSQKFILDISKTKNQLIKQKSNIQVIDNLILEEIDSNHLIDKHIKEVFLTKLKKRFLI